MFLDACDCLYLFGSSIGYASVFLVDLITLGMIQVFTVPNYKEKIL